MPASAPQPRRSAAGLPYQPPAVQNPGLPAPPRGPVGSRLGRRRAGQASLPPHHLRRSRGALCVWGAGRRAAVWLLHSRPWRAAASPASRDPLGKASGQMTVAVRTPRMGAERGPSPLQSWPTVRKGLPVCFLIPLHPRRQVRLLQTQMQPWRRAGPEPGQWASLWRRRPRVPSPNPDPAFWTGC